MHLWSDTQPRITITGIEGRHSFLPYPGKLFKKGLIDHLTEERSSAEREAASQGGGDDFDRQGLFRLGQFYLIVVPDWNIVEDFAKGRVGV